MATYKIDASHSEISFKVKHLMISTVTGKFDKFDATLETEDGDLTHSQITFEADADSINTGSEQRDGHLKSEDFFAAAQFPKLKFKSTGVKKISNEEYLLTGDFTIREVTKPIELNVEYNGEIVDPYGQTKLGFEINGKIKRSEFGLRWNGVTEAGSIVVSDDVKLHLNVQMVKQA